MLLKFLLWILPQNLEDSYFSFDFQSCFLEIILEKHTSNSLGSVFFLNLILASLPQFPPVAPPVPHHPSGNVYMCAQRQLESF